MLDQPSLGHCHISYKCETGRKGKTYRGENSNRGFPQNHVWNSLLLTETLEKTSKLQTKNQPLLPLPAVEVTIDIHTHRISLVNKAWGPKPTETCRKNGMSASPTLTKTTYQKINLWICTHTGPIPISPPSHPQPMVESTSLLKSSLNSSSLSSSSSSSLLGRLVDEGSKKVSTVKDDSGRVR